MERRVPRIDRFGSCPIKREMEVGIRTNQVQNQVQYTAFFFHAQTTFSPGIDSSNRVGVVIVGISVVIVRAFSTLEEKGVTFHFGEGE